MISGVSDYDLLGGEAAEHPFRRHLPRRDRNVDRRSDIAVPKDAEAGVYSLEATLAAKGATIQDRLNFTVQP